MSENNARIEQFRKMAEADPGNELGHFSLAKAYAEAGMTEPAIQSFQRVLELNPAIPRVYQMLAKSLLDAGRKPEAIDRLTKGVEVASARGEIFAPRDEMIKMLRDLGAAVPESAAGTAAGAARQVGEGEVLCGRCGKVKRRLARPPFSNDTGRAIFEKVCADCWREWIGMGTKVINELRLPMSDPKAQKIFDQHMKEFLNL